MSAGVLTRASRRGHPELVNSTLALDTSQILLHVAGFAPPPRFGQIDDKAEELFALAGALSYSRLKKMRHPRAQPFIACGVIDRKPTNVDRQRIYAVLAAHAHR